MRPASVIYTHQASLPRWMYEFQHQLNDGGKQAPPAFLGLVAALREVSAVLLGSKLGHGLLRPHHLQTVAQDTTLAQDGTGPRVKAIASHKLRSLVQQLRKSAQWRDSPERVDQLHTLAQSLLETYSAPAAALAAFDDAAEGFKQELPILDCECRLRTFAQIAELAGHAYKALAGELAGALNDDSFSLIGLGARIAEPASANERDAGVEINERWEICRQGLLRPAPAGLVIAWLVFEDAFLSEGYLAVGPVEFFSGRDYPDSLRNGWWRPDGPPPELENPFSTLLLPETLPDRECVLVRVTLQSGSVAVAQERAVGLVEQVIHMAYDNSLWQLMEGVALFRGGSWFGTRPHSTLERRHFPRGDALSDPTPAHIERLDASLLEALVSEDEHALDAAADRSWLASIGQLDDVSHRVALTVRLLERRLLALTNHRYWSQAATHFLAGWWAEEKILQALGDAAESGIAALPDRFETHPQLTLRFRDLMLPWAGGLSFQIRSAEIMRHAKELAAHLPPGSIARRQLEEVAVRTANGKAAGSWLSELERDFEVLAERAARQRNAVLHGNDTVDEVLTTVDTFLMRMASMVIDEQLEALRAGHTLEQQLARARERAATRDQRLADGDDPADVLLQIGRRGRLSIEDLNTDGSPA